MGGVSGPGGFGGSAEHVERAGRAARLLLALERAGDGATTYGRPSATSARLFVHVNTVYQWPDRLYSVLGAGSRSGDWALELRLALRLAELRGREARAA